MITKAYIYHLARLTREYIYSLWGSAIIAVPNIRDKTIFVRFQNRTIYVPFVNRTIFVDAVPPEIALPLYDHTIEVK